MKSDKLVKFESVVKSEMLVQSDSLVNASMLVQSEMLVQSGSLLKPDMLLKSDSLVGRDQCKHQETIKVHQRGFQGKTEMAQRLFSSGQTQILALVLNLPRPTVKLVSAAVVFSLSSSSILEYLCLTICDICQL